MSLLMEALKQQQTGPTAPNAAPGLSVNDNGLNVQGIGQGSGQGWKVLALVLLVVVGLLAGFVLASLLQRPAPVAAAVTTPPAPASAGQILTDLLAVPASSATSDELAGDTADNSDVGADNEPQLLVSAAKPVNKRSKAGQTLEQQVETVESYADETTFAEQPDMAEADVDEPVTEVPAKPAELTTADVSEELRNKFALALEQSDPMPRHQSVTEHAAPARDIQTLDELLKRQIPPLRFEAHIYASDPQQRWVKVNGKDLQEGQWVTADIQLKEITPQYVLLQTGRQMFSMEALTEWSYRLPNP
jgi:hypothetical protein